MPRGDGLIQIAPDPSAITNPTLDGKPLALHSLDGYKVADSPPYSARASYIQWNGGACDGFVRGIEETQPDQPTDLGLGYWTNASLPFYYSLASIFPLATRWFSSCLGSAIANRRFLIAGTAHGLMDDLNLSRWDMPINGTIFHLLSRYGISWTNYANVNRIRLTTSRLFGGPIARLIVSRISAAIPFVISSTQGNLMFTADTYPLGFREALKHVRTTKDFFRDVEAGTLPSFCIVDPDFQHYSEQSPQDVQLGEAFVATVINSVMHGKCWPSTLLIWLYDSHGGFYDHVPPIPTIPPDDVRKRVFQPGPSAFRGSPLYKEIANLNGAPAAKDYDISGFRVPAVIISPYAKPGYVSNQFYDHTSVLSLIERKWNLPPLTRRDAAAADPLGMIDLQNPPSFLHPPILAKPAKRWKRVRALPINVQPIFTIRSTRDLIKAVLFAAAAWLVGLAVFTITNTTVQTIVVIGLALLIAQGVRLSGFWEQWIFWRTQPRNGQVGLYNAIYAFALLTVFCALIASLLNLHGAFRARWQGDSGGNIFLGYTTTFLWNLVDAVPGLNITNTIHWDAPLEFHDIWSEVLVILFRLLVLAPVLGLAAQLFRRDRPR
jgi:phospholipase C